MWLTVSDFMVMRLVSGFSLSLSLANHSDSELFLVVSALLAKMDSGAKDSGRLVEHMDWGLLSSFDLF